MLGRLAEYFLRVSGGSAAGAQEMRMLGRLAEYFLRVSGGSAAGELLTHLLGEGEQFL